MYKCTLFHSVAGNQWLKSKHYINYFIINRLHEIIPEHMNIQLQNTTWWNEIKPTLWHCLFPSIPSIHHNSIIRLSHGAPLHGTPNGTTRSSLCWTRTLPTACEAFSADCVIYKYQSRTFHHVNQLTAFALQNGHQSLVVICLTIGQLL